MSYKLPEWPLLPPAFGSLDDEAEYYVARADAAIARLRVAVSHMRHNIDCEYKRDMHERRLRHDEGFRLAGPPPPCICGCSEALAAIGDLPPNQNEQNERRG